MSLKRSTLAFDQDYLLKQVTPMLANESRRLFGKRLLSLGAVSMLTGCQLSDENSAEQLLITVSRFTDQAQAFLFDPKRLAPTYPAHRITTPFPFNAFYGQDQIPTVDGNSYRLQLGGLIRDRAPWSLAQLALLPQTSQITRHICVEGWSAIGKWGGVRFADFLMRIGADTTAKYVGFKCADDYYTSIDMATALHSQTLLTLTFADQTLPKEYGYPMKLRIPTKLGFKNPKHITEIYVTNDYPGGYWEDQGYHWFGAA